MRVEIEKRYYIYIYNRLLSYYFICNTDFDMDYVFDYYKKLKKKEIKNESKKR